ncbi:hypothetical protein FRB90_009257 [Tulasnella sp. 427]|nr:hypothetical protein FRB90_009257 [Tulasnella sp. 427]
MSQEQQQQQQQQPHPHWLKATFTACLCSKQASESDDEREVQHGAGPSSTGGRRIFARDELEGLLASASSDEDADAMSLHSNVGRGTRNKRARRKGKKRKDAWGVVGRNLSGNSRRSIQMFGWYPFGKPIALPDSSSDEEQADERSTSRRTRTLSNASDAAPLDPSEIVARMTLEDNAAPTGTAHLDLMRANFEPDATSEDLEREERELAEQEEAAAVAAFSFPAVPQVEPPREASPTVEAAPDPEPEPEPEQAQVQELEVPTEDLDPESATATPSLQTSSTPLTSSSPLTPLSPPPPSSPTKSTAPPPPSGTSTPQTQTHAERIKRAAKEQRRRMKEEAARRKKEDMERRAEAAAGGFEFDSPLQTPHHQQEFGEFQAVVAWTESDGASSHPSQYQYQAPPQNLPPLAALPLHPHPHASEHPLSPSDDELLDYGAEYASRRPTAPTRKLTLGSGSGSERGGPPGRPPHAVPLPPSSLASESPRKPNFMHRATGSGTLSSHSGWSGHQAYHQPMQVPVQPPALPLEVEFDGIPGGLEHHHPHHPLAPSAHAQEFEGVPGGALASRHTRSRAGSVMDSGVAKRTFVPQRSHTSSIDSFAAAGGAGAGFPSTGFGRGGARGLDGAAAAMMLGGDYTQE